MLENAEKGAVSTGTEQKVIRVMFVKLHWTYTANFEQLLWSRGVSRVLKGPQTTSA